ncbi:MAG: nucleotidyltransferase [Bacillota bacterium]|nr:nucleotidyltransferase [Bacillota bacterium]
MENKDLTLVVLAAGMGSRFGGLKQITPMGLNGEAILDFSIYDAMEAGFGKVVFLIKKEIEHDFRTTVGCRIEKIVDVDYAYQEVDMLPSPFKADPGRTKPWGTGHAVLCTKDKVHTPFCSVNSDDYYGKTAFKSVADCLRSTGDICMSGFYLKNTITDNGTVSRGVCKVEEGILKDVTEHTAIDKNSGIPLDSIVSMNFWGFETDIYDYMEKYFVDYLKQNANPLKGEFFLPSVVDRLIKEEGRKVRVLNTPDKWYGVTYKEDAEPVRCALQDMQRRGLYGGMSK